jgi:hypothetical protein
MNKSCSNCHYKFHKEPGFFIGAMYISYAMNIAEVLFMYVLLTPFFDEILDLLMLPFLALGIVLLIFFNVRYSRMIWIYLSNT